MQGFIDLRADWLHEKHIITDQIGYALGFVDGLTGRIGDALDFVEGLSERNGYALDLVEGHSVL